jgi:hypothetical protein
MVVSCSLECHVEIWYKNKKCDTSIHRCLKNIQWAAKVWNKFIKIVELNVRIAIPQLVDNKQVYQKIPPVLSIASNQNKSFC